MLPLLERVGMLLGQRPLSLGLLVGLLLVARLLLLVARLLLLVAWLLLLVAVAVGALIFVWPDLVICSFWSWPFVCWSGHEDIPI